MQGDAWGNCGWQMAEKIHNVKDYAYDEESRIPICYLKDRHVDALVERTRTKLQKWYGGSKSKPACTNRQIVQDHFKGTFASDVRAGSISGRGTFPGRLVA